jgi:hypothetical protein
MAVRSEGQTTRVETARADQMTAFVLMPACLRCGHQGMTRLRDGKRRCNGCLRFVVSIEHAPQVLTRRVT